MKTYQVHPLTAAIFLSLLGMGMIGVFVILPIACLQWSWNSLAVAIQILPSINEWQAGLLYLAAATLLYLFGFVQVDIEAKGAE